ncbi:MAG: hypothetical protein Crog4KO_36560 [Crocinitomicaceae bacterium]
MPCDETHVCPITGDWTYRTGLTSTDKRMISHPSLATFIWDAHLNMMRCTGTFIALYLAKYLSKTEAFGSLDMDEEDVETVGLPSDVTIEDAQFPPRFFKDRVMGTSEVKFHCLGRETVLKEDVIIELNMNVNMLDLHGSNTNVCTIEYLHRLNTATFRRI